MFGKLFGWLFRKKNPKPDSTNKPKSPLPDSAGPVSKPADLPSVPEPAIKPVEPAIKPVEPPNKPVEPASKPVEPASKPVEPTNKPVEPTNKPVEPASKPVEPVNKPAEPVNKPAEPVNKPFRPPTDLMGRTLNPPTPIPKMNKICPRSGEVMKEVEILGERIDISSKGCYFDKGELARILGTKPTFLQSVSSFFKTGKADPRASVDSGIEHLRVDQEILDCKNKLNKLDPQSQEFKETFEKLEKLTKEKNRL